MSHPDVGHDAGCLGGHRGDCAVSGIITHTCARCGTAEPSRLVHPCHWDSERCVYKVTLCEDCCEAEA